MPLVSQTFDQLLDFTRTTSGTFVGSNGLIQTTPASANLLTWTQQFNQSGTWAVAGTSIAVNTTVAPDGTSTADTLIENTAAATDHRLTFPSAVTTTGQTYTYSIYVKAAGRNYVALVFNGEAKGKYFDIANGTVLGDFTGAPISASITSVGNGWYRCSVTSSVISALTNLRVYLSTDGTNYAYTGDGTSGVFVWGAQLEAVPAANLVLGTELVTNGGFATDTDWTKGTGWTIGSGAAQASAGAFSAITQPISFTAGKTYRVSFDVTAYSAGNIRASFTGGTQVTGAARAAAGQYLVYMTAVAGNATLAIGADGSGFTGTIDNVTVKEITAITGMPSTYTRNNGGVFPPRFDYDPVTLAPKGILIEEQRTNLVLRSEEFDNAAWNKSGVTVTANAIASPDGTVDADQFTKPANPNTSVFASATSVAGTAYTVSAYFKSGTLTKASLTVISGTTDVRYWFDLAAKTVGGAISTFTTGYLGSSIQDVGNGWLRCTLTVTAQSTSINGYLYPDKADNSVAGSVYAWGAQLEAGAFATSYIPTLASQVTRAADQCSIVAPNFAPWYNQSEGTFVAQFDVLSVANTNQHNIVALFTSGTNDMRIWLWEGQPTIVRWGATNGTPQADITSSAVTANTVIKAAAAYKLNDFAASYNGAATVTDTSATVPTGFSQLNIGTYTGPTGTMCGHIRSIRYYPVRLSDAQLQALSA